MISVFRIFRVLICCLFMRKYLVICFTIAATLIGCDFYELDSPPGCIPDLVSEWKFEEETGNVAMDSRGRNNGEIIGAPERVNGEVLGNALRFNVYPDTNYVKSEGNRDFQFASNSFTLEARIMSDIDGLIGGERHHIAGGLDTYPGYQIYLNSSGFLGARISRADSINQFIIGEAATGDDMLTDGKWHHVVVVFDQDKLEMRRYVDGFLYGEITDIDRLTGDSDRQQEFTIGANMFARSMEPFAGAIDEVRVYARALTFPEITQRFMRQRC